MSTIATDKGGPPPSEAPVAKAEPSGRAGSITAIVCVVLAALLTTPALIAYWGQRTINDTERYVATVGPLVSSPEVQDVLATKVTDAVQKQVDIETLLNDVFKGVIDDAPRLQRLVGPLSAAINGLIDRVVREFLASDEFADIWTRVNTRVQQTLQKLLNGESSGAISLQGDQVVLEVSELIDRVKELLVDKGLTFVENAPIPDVDKQIVLADAPQVKQLRTIYAFGNPIAKWLLPLVGIMYLVALVLARRRPRMLVAVGAVIAFNAVLIAIALSVGRQLFINDLAGTVFGPASRVFYDTLLAYLERGQEVVLWLGLILVVAGWFAGANRYGTATRTTLSGGFESAGARMSDGPVEGAGHWVAANVVWLRLVAVVLGFVVLLWGNNADTERLWWSLALVVLLLVVLQVLVGAGKRVGRTVLPAAPGTV